jgi:small-conductance mechanosensitive channel
MLNVLTKKVSYTLGAILLLACLTVHVIFGDASDVLAKPMQGIVLVILLAVPLILALALGRMYAAPRLPKDISWLWIAFFVNWAFLCSNIVVLISRQSTMQYGTLATALEYIGISYRAVEAVARLEPVMIQGVLFISAILLFFMLPYAYWGKHREKRAES